MSKRTNDLIPLLLALLVTGGLLGGTLWWVVVVLGKGGGAPAGPVQVSLGEVSFFPNPSSAKLAGLTASEPAIAQQQFQQSLQANRNDPEARIYLNNAIAAQGAAVRIAASLPITGDPNAALEMMRGISQAQEEINQAGGINGAKLQVLLADDRNDPATATAVAQAFAQNKDILAVVGPYASDMSLAAGEVYRQQKLVAISPVSTSVQLSNFSPYFFRTVPSDYVAARALADYALTKLNKRSAVIFFNSKSSYSLSLKSEFAAAMGLGGGQVVEEVDLQPGFSAADSLRAARDRGADVIMLAPNTSTLDEALQVVAVNQGQVPMVAGDDVYSPKTLELGQANAEGMVVAVPWHIEGQPGAVFPQRSLQLWGGDVSWRTALSYDATQAIAAAMQQSTVQPPNRQSLRDALATNGFSVEGAAGPVRFQPSGDRNASIQLVTVKPGSRSGRGFDFVPIR